MSVEGKRSAKCEDILFIDTTMNAEERHMYVL